MKTLHSILLLASFLALMLLPTGCASVRDWARKPEVAATAKIAARKAAEAAGRAVIAAGLSQLDRSKKADFLQGLSDALWTEVPNVINAQTVAEIARAWTPDKSHWEALAGQLATDFAARQPATREEALAILHSYADGIYRAATSTTAAGPAAPAPSPAQ